MKTKLIILMCLLAISGCQTGDMKISIAVEDVPVAHDGYNVGPELYLRAGEPAKANGLVIWIKGLEPHKITPSSDIPNLEVLGR
jgi:hypothetical protein